MRHVVVVPCSLRNGCEELGAYYGVAEREGATMKQKRRRPSWKWKCLGITIQRLFGISQANLHVGRVFTLSPTSLDYIRRASLGKYPRDFPRPEHVILPTGTTDIKVNLFVGHRYRIATVSRFISTLHYPWFLSPRIWRWNEMSE